VTSAENPPGTRGFQIALVLAVLIGIATALLFSVLTAFNCAEGDGGSPYVAVDSDQAAFCGATGDGVGLLAIALAGVGLAAFFAWRVWRGRGREGRTGALAVGLLVVSAAAPLGATVLYNAPSDSCSAEEQAEYDDWLYNTNRSQRSPYECDTY
jgi:hypothetical protein